MVVSLDYMELYPLNAICIQWIQFQCSKTITHIRWISLKSAFSWNQFERDLFAKILSVAETIFFTFSEIWPVFSEIFRMSSSLRSLSPVNASKACNQISGSISISWFGSICTPLIHCPIEASGPWSSTILLAINWKSCSEIGRFPRVKSWGNNSQWQTKTRRFSRNESPSFPKSVLQQFMGMPQWSTPLRSFLNLPTFERPIEMTDSLEE